MCKRKVTGFTLIEVMVMVTVMSVFFVIISGIFYALSKGTFLSKSRTIANNLAQEKIEYLKNYTYYRLLVTKQSDIASYGYDNSYYPPEQLIVGDILFTRTITVQKVSETGTGSSRHLEVLSESDPDTSLKEIKVTVSWLEGNVTKSLSLSNLREDPDRSPLDGYIYGTITSTSGTALSGANVYAMENPDYSGTTDAGGAYQFDVSSGSYHVKVSKTGYFDSVSGLLAVAPGGNAAYSAQLSARLTGFVTGYVCINTDLVIGQVVASTVSPTGFNQEFIELFNPTTFQIKFGIGGNIAFYKLKYAERTAGIPGPNDFVLRTIKLNSFIYLDPVVPSYGYLLIANTSPVIINGISKDADLLMYDDGPDAPAYPNPVWGFIEENESGGLCLTDNSDNNIDRVAWKDNGGMNQAPAIATEGTPYDFTGVFAPDYLIRRSHSKPPLGSWFLGAPATDTDNNDYDFGYQTKITASYFQNSSSPVSVPIYGKPAVGAIVSCNDGLSSSVIAQGIGSPPTGAYFEIPGIATGTWIIAISSNNAYMEVSTISVRAGQYTTIPNDNTTPSFTSSLFRYATTILSDNNIEGIISGRVIDASNNPIPDVLMDANGTQIRTNNDGRYSLRVATNAFVTANYNYDKTNYTTYTTTYAVNILQGQISSIADITLYTAGQIEGWVTTNRIDSLPGIIMLADGAMNDYTAISGDGGGNAGYFLIRNVRAGNYTVSPQLDTSESSSPTVKTVTVAAGAKVWSSSFTVQSASGKFSGRVYEGTNLIKTGVLLIATTATIGGDPPMIDSSYMTGATLYYSALSKDDGTYEVSVRASTTTLYNIYGWYTKVTGPGTETVKKTKANNGVLPGANTTVDFGPGTALDSW
ncbi:MAG: hypothetical protein A2297_00875 [Elusimicrobia bacterium RIFOXYB2_FULL_48_7]|nr:MAG: hypothetical protein A2297_00875 [Elusimicrobia bacterium RIFOXYB2_FULL_48_7]